jgi:hypothetical protein
MGEDPTMVVGQICPIGRVCEGVSRRRIGSVAGELVVIKKVI